MKNESKHKIAKEIKANFNLVFYAALATLLVGAVLYIGWMPPTHGKVSPEGKEIFRQWQNSESNSISLGRIKNNRSRYDHKISALEDAIYNDRFDYYRQKFHKEWVWGNMKTVFLYLAPGLLLLRFIFRSARWTQKHASDE